MKNRLTFSLIALAGILLFGSVVHASPLGLEPTRFETSLVAPISSTATSMNLVTGTNNDGTSLSGFQCFTIDSNQPNVEDVCGTVNGIFVTNMTRGISGSTGTTSVSALESSHRRGADVKTSDEPFLVILSRIVNQIDGFSNPIGYDGTVATSTIANNRNNLADWGLVQDTALQGSGAIAATISAKGYVQLATALQQASSTPTGSSGAALSLYSANATDTPTYPCNTGYTAAGAGCAVVANPLGHIAANFVASSTNFSVSATTTVATSTTIGSTWAFDIGKHEQVFTTAGTSTWAIPNGIHTLFIRLVGSAGGTGTGGTCQSGGGTGGYAETMANVSATTSVQVVVGGVVPAGSVGSTTDFSTFLSAGGAGAGNNTSSSNSVAAGGSGGNTFSGAQFSSTGANGVPTFDNSSGVCLVVSAPNSTPLGIYGTSGQPGAIIVQW